MGTTNLDSLTLDGTLTLGGGIVAVDVVNLEGLAAGEDALSLPDVASGGVLAVHTTDAMTHSIRIQTADGTNYYIMATTTITNRTGGA